MAKYKFRIFVERNNNGTNHYDSWIANKDGTTSDGFSDFYFIDTTEYLTYSASQALDVIDNMMFCDGKNTPLYTGSIGSTGPVVPNSAFNFVSSSFSQLSASIVGSPLTGSIKLTDRGDLIRYKFFGEKVCSVLGFPENIWIYPENAVISNTGSEESRIRGNLQSKALTVTNTFSISNIGSITSDLPFRIDKQSDRWIKWLNVTSSANVYENNLLLGYNSDADTYELKNNQSAQDAAKFVISASAIDIGGHADSGLTVGGTNPRIIVQDLSSTTEFLTMGVEATSHDMMIGWDDADDLHLGVLENPTDPTIDTKMIIQSDGKVGINTTAPTEKLVVHGNISASGYLEIGNATISGSTNTNIGNKNNGYIDLKSDSSTYGVVIRDYNSTAYGHLSANDGYFELGYNTATGPLYITDLDDVGIGTNAPNMKLHISSSDADILHLQRSSNANVAVKFTNTIGSMYAGIDSVSSANFWGVGTSNDMSGGHKLVVRATGNVGIGTNDPASKLHIANGSNYIYAHDTTLTDSQDAYLTVRSGTASHKIAGLNLKIDSTNLWQLLTDNADGNRFHIQYGDDATKRFFTVEVGGKVGIGTNDPDELLTIYGGSNPKLHIINTAENDAGIKFSDSAAISTQNFEILHNCSTEDLRFRSDTVDNILYMEHGGNVGIGTAVPEAKLHILQDSDGDPEGLLIEGGGSVTAQNQIVLRDLGTSDANINRIQFEETANEYKIGRIEMESEGSSAANGGTMRLYTYSNAGSTANSNQLVLKRDGNVEIAKNLSVTGNISSSAFSVGSGNGRFYSDSGGRTAFTGGQFYIMADTSNTYLYSTNTYLGNASGDTIKLRGNTFTGDGTFKILSGSVECNTLHIDKGHLGGTLGNQILYLTTQNKVSNAAKLEFSSQRTANGTDWTSAGERIQAKIDSTWMGYMQFNGDVNNYGISFGTGNSTAAPQNVAERMRIDSSGEVGINNTSPAAMLDVKSSGSPPMRLDRMYHTDAIWFQTATQLHANPHTFVDNGDNDGASGGVGFRWYMGNSGVGETMKIHPEGQVTHEKNPSFTAQKVGNQTISANSWQDVTFTTELYDTNSNYSTATSRFTAPVAGRYLFFSQICMDVSDTTAYVGLRILKNGSTIRYGQVQDTNEGGNMENVTINLQHIIPLSANDYMEIQMYSATATSVINQQEPQESVDNTYFAGHLIG